MEVVEGELLGSLAARLSPEEADGAWRAAGAALAAVHAVDGVRAATAGCARAGILAPSASRGPYHHGEALSTRAAGRVPLRAGRAGPDSVFPRLRRAAAVAAVRPLPPRTRRFGAERACGRSGLARRERSACRG